MRLIALNGLVMMVVSAPLLAFQYLWGMEKHPLAGFLLWFVTLGAVYLLLLPALGLELSHNPTMPWN